jgi:hypothetical protein
MVLVAAQFKVLVSEIEWGLDLRIEAHLWWGIGVRDSWISAYWGKVERWSGEQEL